MSVIPPQPWDKRDDIFNMHMHDDFLGCNSNPPGRYGVQSVLWGPALAGEITFDKANCADFEPVPEQFYLRYDYMIKARLHGSIFFLWPRFGYPTIKPNISQMVSHWNKTEQILIFLQSFQIQNRRRWQSPTLKASCEIVITLKLISRYAAHWNSGQVKRFVIWLSSRPLKDSAFCGHCITQALHFRQAEPSTIMISFLCSAVP